MSNRFRIKPTPLSGFYVLERLPIADDRGYLERLFCNQELHAAGVAKPIAQINRTHTKGQGTVRGFHFQHSPHTETKIVTCLSGEVFDVAIDLREGSATFLKWHAEVLSATSNTSVVIPEGFAHGYQLLSDSCELLYFHTTSYCRDADGGVNALDPAFAIAWPKTVVNRSVRDAGFAFIEESYSGITL